MKSNLIYKNPKKNIKPKRPQTSKNIHKKSPNILASEESKKSAIQGMISEFQSRKEKINQNNATDLENQRTKLTELLDQKIKEVKDKETEKEKETKKLKDDR